MPPKTEYYSFNYESPISNFYSRLSFPRTFEQIKDLYDFNFALNLYDFKEEEYIKSKFKTKNKAVLNNE